MRWAHVLLIIILISAIAPFIASENPDGLQKTAEIIGVQESSFPALMPGYTVGFLKGDVSGVVAMITGVLIVFTAGYAIIRIRRRS